jgi:hypothetical protein
VRDFVDADGRIIQAEEMMRRGMPRMCWLEWMAIARNLDQNKLKVDEGRCPLRFQDMAREEDIEMVIGEERFRMSLLTYSNILKRKAEAIRKEVTPPYVTRIAEEHDRDMQGTWDGPRTMKRVTPDTKMRSFILQFSLGLCYTNKDYHRFGFRESAKCAFCDEPRQNFKHLFFECNAVKELWDAVESRNIIPERATLDNKIFGTLDIPTNYIIFHLHRFVHRQNFHDEKLNHLHFLGEMRKCKRVEKEIAIKRNALRKYEVKWASISSKLNL